MTNNIIEARVYIIKCCVLLISVVPVLRLNWLDRYCINRNVPKWNEKKTSYLYGAFVEPKIQQKLINKTTSTRTTTTKNVGMNAPCDQHYGLYCGKDVSAFRKYIAWWYWEFIPFKRFYSSVEVRKVSSHNCNRNSVPTISIAIVNTTQFLTKISIV